MPFDAIDPKPTLKQVPRTAVPIPAESQAIIEPVLDRAIEILETSGWCQGQEAVRLANGETHFCLVGAINRAAFETRWAPYRAIVHVYSVMNARETRVNLRLVDWNDAPGRTRDDVIALLKEARESSDAI